MYMFSLKLVKIHGALLLPTHKYYNHCYYETKTCTLVVSQYNNYDCLLYTADCHGVWSYKRANICGLIGQECLDKRLIGQVSVDSLDKHL